LVKDRESVVSFAGINNFGFASRDFVGTLSASPTSLIAALPDVAAARGLQSAARASALAARRNAESDVSSSLQSKARAAKAEARNLARITVKLDRVVSTIEKAIERLTSIKEIIADMRRQAVTAKGASVPVDERRVFGDRFDQYLGTLNTKVKLAGFIGTNIIGTSIRDDFDPDELTYQTEPDALVKKTVTGIYSQSDFYIEDGGGDKYYPDIYGSVLTKFPNPADEDGITVSTEDTVVYDDSTGAFDLTKSGDASPTLSGTVVKKGLGILFSFLYNNFDDDTNIQRAIDDVDDTSKTIRFNIAFLEAELAKAQSAQTLVEGKIKTSNEFAAGVEADLFGEQQRQALEAQRSQLLFNSTLQSTLSFDRFGGGLTLNAASLYDFTV
jgi:hypothetical protein